MTAAAARGIDVAIDLAFQASPDHPWVKDHPAWFRHLPDGSIRYAENPPKRYEDIYPLDFETDDWQALWAELLDVVRFWVAQGVKVFRVDNPHTKPFAFWEWMIRLVKADHPEVIFLSEAFTRPAVMQHLAKVGFTQSYTYFTWRNAKWELETYLTELTKTDVAAYFRPNFWPNTPDILHESLQTGGRAAFLGRLVLAATLSSNYGIYGPAFELQEHVPRSTGSEEYAHSEKYEVRSWDLARPDSLSEFIARVNKIRRDHPALQFNDALQFHRVDNDQIIAFSKTRETGSQETGTAGRDVDRDRRQPRPRPRAVGVGGSRSRRARAGPRTAVCHARSPHGSPVPVGGDRQLRPSRPDGTGGAPVHGRAGRGSVVGGRTRMTATDLHIVGEPPEGLIVAPTSTGWYKDAVIYEVHVRAFHDGNGDGVGDFRGLIDKLDYLAELGVTALWLLPFYPSPLRDDGYDISDYRQVHPSYGSLRDFRLFLREAHRRGLRVITELVLAHTSDEHPWFQRARLAKPGSVHRDFYVWSDTPDRFAGARIIFKDFEDSNWSFDPVAQAYFWHRFYSHQPSLNYDNPSVRQAMLDVVDYWLAMGVDGLRLDAVPYLYAREGTTCENLPETFAFLRQLRAHVDARFGDRMLLAEANQWPEDAVAYMGNGDTCHMAFHFPLMPRMFMAARQEDRFPMVDILAETPATPPECQWALFLRNHDELTLEMVTDEERDYMYRAYAQDPQARVNVGIRRRLAPLLGNDRKLMEMMNGLLFSMPGTPIIYYGDEIGMGDNIYLGDRNAVRTPMQWNSDRNAGFSAANPQRLYLPVIIDPEYHSQAVNVEAQEENPNSLLWWMKRLIALRQRYKAFGRGTLEVLRPDNRKVFAFIRRFEDERILVVVNLSRNVQCVELDLAGIPRGHALRALRELEVPLGRRPAVLHHPGPPRVLLVLARAEVRRVRAPAPVLRGPGRVGRALRRSALREFEAFLPAYLADAPVVRAEGADDHRGHRGRLTCRSWPPPGTAGRSRGVSRHRAGAAGPRQPRALLAATLLRHRRPRPRSSRNGTGRRWWPT